MLNETRDTVTVPAAFMIRMLASMNRVRRGGLLIDFQIFFSSSSLFLGLGRQSDGRQSEVPDDD